MASPADKAQRAILFGGSRANVPLSCRIAFSWNRSDKGLCILRRLRLSVPAPHLPHGTDAWNLHLTRVGALRRWDAAPRVPHGQPRNGAPLHLGRAGANGARLRLGSQVIAPCGSPTSPRVVSWGTRWRPHEALEEPRLLTKCRAVLRSELAVRPSLVAADKCGSAPRDIGYSPGTRCSGKGEPERRGRGFDRSIGGRVRVCRILATRNVGPAVTPRRRLKIPACGATPLRSKSTRCGQGAALLRSECPPWRCELERRPQGEPATGKLGACSDHKKGDSDGARRRAWFTRSPSARSPATKGRSASRVARIVDFGKVNRFPLGDVTRRVVLVSLVIQPCAAAFSASFVSS